MRFLIGLLLGFAVGFGAAILFAPERQKRQEKAWEATPPPEEPVGGPLEDHDIFGALRRAIRSLQTQLREAWSEAGDAAEEAEREMWARYEQTTRRKARSRQ